MNKKGQALVEFVLIIPVFIFILFAIIDFGIIINAKNNLENKVIDVRTMTKNGYNTNQIMELINKNNNYQVNLNIEKETTGYKIKLTTELDLVTPGLNLIISSPYVVEVVHYAYY